MPRKPAPAPKKTSRATSPKKKAGTSKTAAKASKTAKPTSRTSKTAKKTTKSASKPVAAKSTAKSAAKPAAKAPKPASAKKSTTKPAAKPPAKAATKPAAKPTHAAADHKPAKPAPAPKTKPAPKGKAAAPAPAPAASDAQNKRKGISIVGGKGGKSGGKKSGSALSSNPHRSQLLGPNAPKRAPLIPSGPGAASANSASDDGSRKPTKSPFRKRELDKFREVLLQKRAALIGDISTLEAEALNLGRDERSHTPQHMAEQGSDSAEQTLALGLAAADRKLIREIDDAIKRIDEGRYGLCEMTGRPIRVERLRELPWARYSIDAARELERRSNPGSW